MAIERTILGWDVGGTKSAAVVGTADGRILARREWPSRAGRGPEAMIGDFLDAAAALRAELAEPVGVGVSIGGPLDTLHGVVKSPPHLPGWDEIALADRLADALQRPAVVEHDAAACLLAEWLWGVARDTTHAAYLTCGTGFGAGLMIDGRLVRGPAGQSPEIGHVRLAPTGPKLFGKRGSAESFCSGQGVGELAPFLFSSRFDRPSSTAELARLADQGDLVAQAVLRESAGRTGQACAILADLFSPQVIVLGTLARVLPAWWLDAVRNGFAEEALPINAARTRIVPASLGNLQDLSPIAAFVHHRP